MQETLQQEKDIRVGCYNFVRIIADGTYFPDGEKRYALLLNRASAFRGTVRNNHQPTLSLTPIGGGTEMTPEGKALLEEMLLPFGSITYEHANDLRLRIAADPKAIDLFKTFFHMKHHENEIQIRETTAMREFEEETVDEYPIFTKEDLNKIHVSTVPHTYENIFPSFHGKKKGPVLFFSEVYDATLPDELIQKLISIQNHPEDILEDTLARCATYYRADGVAEEKVERALKLLRESPYFIRFATKEEIQNGETWDEIQIAPASKSLLIS